MGESGFESEYPLSSMTGSAKAFFDNQRPIAIVDDDPDDQERLRREVQSLFGEVPLLFFENGASLVRYMDTHMRDNERPRLIFLDLLMHGMDGLTALELLQGRLGMAGVPIIVVSNAQHASQIHRAFENGAQAFLPKPVTRFDMVRILQGKFQQQMKEASHR